ncbi:MAG TPA: hypothetical protein VJ882_06170 [Desulfuromonadales bacterium]|nr:hypothetical protein [Desulfuromonadales bacterium]
MDGLIIAEENLESRKRMADLFIDSGYTIMVTSTIGGVLYGVFKHAAQVVLLSETFDELKATSLVPLLKKCDRNLAIVLISAEPPLALMRRLRGEGIFYHCLTPRRAEDRDELRQVVRCAFEALMRKKCILNHRN